MKSRNNIENVISEAIRKVVNEKHEDKQYETVRNAIKPIVYEEVMRHINEVLEEKKNKNKSEESTKKKRQKVTANKMRQVLKMLNQDKVDMAAVARKLYPDMSDDTRRSLISKKSRGERPLNDEEVTEIYRLLRTTDN